MGGAVSSGRDNNELIDNLVGGNYIRTRCVERVFRALDRAEYMTPDARDQAYKDLAWRNGQLHMSAPCIYSEVMEGLELKAGLSFLNIGSGTGYLSTLVGLIIGPSGISHGVEYVQGVVDYANKKLSQFQESSPALDEFDFCEPKFYCGNGLCLAPLSTPYDRVYCGAGCPEEYQSYFKQLIKVGGILVMPLNDNLLQVKRTGPTEWSTRCLLNVSFAQLRVPTKKEAQDLVRLEELSPESLQCLSRGAVRATLRGALLTRLPALRAPPPRQPPAKKACPRRIYIPVDDDSDNDSLNALHDLDRASGRHEMNALLSLVLSMGHNRVAGALRVDPLDSPSGSSETDDDRRRDEDNDDRPDDGAAVVFDDNHSNNSGEPPRSRRRPSGDGPNSDPETDREELEHPPIARSVIMFEFRDNRDSSPPEADRRRERTTEESTEDKMETNDNSDEKVTNGLLQKEDENLKSPSGSGDRTERQTRKDKSPKRTRTRKNNSRHSSEDNSRDRKTRNDRSRHSSEDNCGDKKSRRDKYRHSSGDNSGTRKARRNKSRYSSEDNSRDRKTSRDKSRFSAEETSRDRKTLKHKSPYSSEENSSDRKTPRDTKTPTPKKEKSRDRNPRKVKSRQSSDDDSEYTKAQDKDSKKESNCEVPAEVEIYLGKTTDNPGTSMEWTEEKVSSEDETETTESSKAVERRQKFDSGLGEENTPSSGTSPVKSDKSDSDDPDDSHRSDSLTDDVCEDERKGRRRRQKRAHGQVSNRSSSSSSSDDEDDGERRSKRRPSHDTRRVRLSILMKRSVEELPLPYPLKRYVNLGRCFEF